MENLKLESNGIPVRNIKILSFCSNGVKVNAQKLRNLINVTCENMDFALGFIILMVKCENWTTFSYYVYYLVKAHSFFCFTGNNIVFMSPFYLLYDCFIYMRNFIMH